MSDVVLEVSDLHKTFRVGFFGRRVQALSGVSFRVRRGEVFGLLGPNGAGKTTTLKIALGLVRPTRGEVRLFGLPSSDKRAREKLGFMPENPYVYQMLTPVEFLDLCGTILGMPKKQRDARAAELIERVGLGHAKDRPIGKFSKGMTQRMGLAQCLLQDPELIVVDEPMSGLDPIGRKEVRDLLLAERARGKTIVMTTHILNDVEVLCDHVAIVQRGTVVAAGALSDLLRAEARQVEVELRNVSEGLQVRLGGLGVTQKQARANTVVVADGAAVAQQVLTLALSEGAEIVSMTPHKDTLEDLFVRNAMRTGD